MALILLKLLGAWNWLRKAATALFDLARRYPESIDSPPMVLVKSQRYLSLLSSSNRFAKTIEKSQMGFTVANFYSRSPLSSGLKNCDTRNPALVGLAQLLVSHIFRMSHGSKVVNSVIASNAIYVVNEARRPFSIKDGPCHPMRTHRCSENASTAIATGNVIKGLFPAKATVPNGACSSVWEKAQWPLFPVEKSSFRTVGKKLPDSFGAYNRFFSHSAVLSRWGQGRALFHQRFRPDFLNRFTIRSQGLAPC